MLLYYKCGRGSTANPTDSVLSCCEQGIMINRNLTFFADNAARSKRAAVDKIQRGAKLSYLRMGQNTTSCDESRAQMKQEVEEFQHQETEGPVRPLGDEEVAEAPVEQKQTVGSPAHLDEVD